MTFWQLPEGFVQGDAKKSTGKNLQYLKGLKTKLINSVETRCFASSPRQVSILIIMVQTGNARLNC
jgi:hypothetical protein